MNKEAFYSDLRTNLKAYIDKVCEDHAPLLIKQRNGDNVVVISEEDYTSLEETAYLSSPPNNLKRVLTAQKRHSGKTLEDVKREFGI